MFVYKRAFEYPHRSCVLPFPLPGSALTPKISSRRVELRLDNGCEAKLPIHRLKNGVSFIVDKLHRKILNYCGPVHNPPNTSFDPAEALD